MKEELTALLKEHQPDIYWTFQDFAGCTCNVEFEYSQNNPQEDQYAEHLAEVIAKYLEEKK